MGSLLGICLLLGIMFGTLGAVIASQKQAGVVGFVLGFLFGPLGVMAACFLDDRPTCPRCCGPVPLKGNICPSVCVHCQTALVWQHGKLLARDEQTSGNEEGTQNPNLAVVEGTAGKPPAETKAGSAFRAFLTAEGLWQPRGASPSTEQSQGRRWTLPRVVTGIVLGIPAIVLVCRFLLVWLDGLAHQQEPVPVAIPEVQNNDPKPTTRCQCFGARTRGILARALAAMAQGDGVSLGQMVDAGEIVTIQGGMVVTVEEATSSGEARIQVEGVAGALWLRQDWLRDGTSRPVPAPTSTPGSTRSHLVPRTPFTQAVDSMDFDQRIRVWAAQFDRSESWVRHHVAPGDSAVAANRKLVEARLREERQR